MFLRVHVGTSVDKRVDEEKTPRVAMIFVHVFLALQLCLALSYYVAGGDSRDERFAWRMFSSTRMERCRVLFAEEQLGSKGVSSKKTVQTSSLFHEAWLTLAARGRPSVVDAMARQLCEARRGRGIYVQMTCTHHGESDVVRPGVFDVCATGGI